jgi:lipid A disaccharide synthetase
MTHTAPILFTAAARLQASAAFRGDGDVPHVSISVSHPRYRNYLTALAQTAGLCQVQWVVGVPTSVLGTLDVALATSGTMTLELALSGVPLVSVYRFHPFSYRIAKWLIGKKIKAMGHFSLPNLMLKTRLVPEFLQDEATPVAVATAAESLLTNSEVHATIQAGYAKLRERLGSGGATQRAACEIFAYLQR